MLVPDLTIRDGRLDIGDDSKMAARALGRGLARIPGVTLAVQSVSDATGAVKNFFYYLWQTNLGYSTERWDAVSRKDELVANIEQVVTWLNHMAEILPKARGASKFANAQTYQHIADWVHSQLAKVHATSDPEVWFEILCPTALALQKTMATLEQRSICNTTIIPIPPHKKLLAEVQALVLSYQATIAHRLLSDPKYDAIQQSILEAKASLTPEQEVLDQEKMMEHGILLTQGDRVLHLAIQLLAFCYRADMNRSKGLAPDELEAPVQHSLDDAQAPSEPTKASLWKALLTQISDHKHRSREYVLPKEYADFCIEHDKIKCVDVARVESSILNFYSSHQDKPPRDAQELSDTLQLLKKNLEACFNTEADIQQQKQAKP